MKNYFLSATIIAISLLTFSCSNDDESIADANPTTKEIIVTESKTVEGKSSNIKSEKNNVARVVLCSVTGGGSTLRDAVVVAQRKLSRTLSQKVCKLQ